MESEFNVSIGKCVVQKPVRNSSKSPTSQFQLEVKTYEIEYIIVS